MPPPSRENRLFGLSRRHAPVNPIACLLSIILYVCPPYAAPPPELPGDELTEQQIYSTKLRRGDPGAAALDTVLVNTARASRSRLDAAMDTWHAPPLSVQQAADETMVPFGKGGIFIPRFTETNAEPGVEIYDMKDNLAGSGETGRTYALEPGEYRIMLGSGTVNQRIIRPVRVEEGRTQPLIPDWSGLIVEVVDEQGIALKGEYELVRIDEFDPYGPGYGASVELGETVKAWIIKPGVYKILGAGEGYNTLTNFVTVRLMPGELTNFLLIQDPDNNFRIRGGGTVQLTPTTKLTSNWRFGVNLGVNVQFNTEIDHQAGVGANTFSLGGLLDAWLLYRKKPVEWSTRLRLEEGINVTDNSLENMGRVENWVNNPDRLLMSSIFIWRVFNWFGPYARAEFNTRFFDAKLKLDDENGFTRVNPDYVFNAAAGIDTSRAFMVEPRFSPLIFELGAGVSADWNTRHYFEASARAGFSSAYSRYDDRHRVIEGDKVKYESADSLEQKVLVSKSIVLYPEGRVNVFEVGPQMSLSATVRIGVMASAAGEIKLFTPVIPDLRVDRPDMEFSGTLSWRLSSVLNLDYTYRQSLRQPAELDVPVHTSSHGIWLRLHYTK